MSELYWYTVLKSEGYAAWVDGDLIAPGADAVGHSSIETTRIYLISTEAEYAKELARWC